MVARIAKSILKIVTPTGHAVTLNIHSVTTQRPLGHESREAIFGPEPLVARATQDAPVPLSFAPSMALLLHEFATNSAKYGSLSAAEGQIEIDCGNHGQNVVLTWTEREGPAVAPPADNEGFGAVLVRSTVKGQLCGDISYDWSSGGLVIRLSIPKARLSE